MIESGKYQIPFDIENDLDELFKVVINEIFDRERTSCILRIYTDQMIDDVVCEIYSFVVFQNGELVSISASDVEQAMNTDCVTGKPTTPDKNLIYCDIEGNRIAAFDLI